MERPKQIMKLQPISHCKNEIDWFQKQHREIGIQVMVENMFFSINVLAHLLLKDTHTSYQSAKVPCGFSLHSLIFQWTRENGPQKIAKSFLGMITHQS